MLTCRARLLSTGCARTPNRGAGRTAGVGKPWVHAPRLGVGENEKVTDRPWLRQSDWDVRFEWGPAGVEAVAQTPSSSST